METLQLPTCTQLQQTGKSYNTNMLRTGTYFILNAEGKALTPWDPINWVKWFFTALSSAN